jgi:hypothetical protein
LWSRRVEIVPEDRVGGARDRTMPSSAAVAPRASARELRQLVEEQDAAMRETRLAGSGWAIAWSMPWSRKARDGAVDRSNPATE